MWRVEPTKVCKPQPGLGLDQVVTLIVSCRQQLLAECDGPDTLLHMSVVRRVMNRTLKYLLPLSADGVVVDLHRGDRR